MAIYTEIELLDHRVNCLGEEKKERGVGNKIIVVQSRHPSLRQAGGREERGSFFVRLPCHLGKTKQDLNLVP